MKGERNLFFSFLKGFFKYENGKKIFIQSDLFMIQLRMKVY